MVYIPFDSLTSLAGDRDMDLKSVEPWFGLSEKNIFIKYIGKDLKGGTFPHQNYSSTEKCTNNN